MKKILLTLVLAGNLLTSSAFALDDYFWYTMADMTISNGYNQVNYLSTQYSDDLDSFDSSFQSAYLSSGKFANYTAAKSSFDAFYDDFNTQKLANLAYQPIAFVGAASSLGNMINDQGLKIALSSTISTFTAYSDTKRTQLTSAASYYNNTQSAALSSYYQSVPEPSTYGLIGLGALGVAFVARRRKQKTA